MTSLIISLGSLLIAVIAIQYGYYRKNHPNGPNGKCNCS
jgi:hypothetical protein